MIDVHTHILPETWPSWTQRSGYAGWIELAHHKPGCAKMQATTSVDGSSPPKFFREIGCNCWSAPVRLQEMDKAGVRVQVLSTVPVMFAAWAKAKDAYDLHRLLNDHLASLVRSGSGRFEALGCVPMHDPELACRELDRCMDELGHRGIQIGTHVGGANLDEPGPRAVLRHAARRGAAVFVHPWDMLAPERMSRYWMPWLVGMPTETTLAIMSLLYGGVLGESPELRVCFAHGGGSFPGTIGRIAHGLACRPDLFPAGSCDPREFLASDGRPAAFWVDSLVHDQAALRQLMALFSPSRVCLGTDYPFPLGEEPPGQTLASMPEIVGPARRAILEGAAVEFLGMSRERAGMCNVLE